MDRQLGRFNRTNIVAVVAIGLLTTAGCGQTRTGVYGHVTLGGKRLSEAVIMFVPLHAGAGKTGASIIDGSYALDAGNGLLPNDYRVEIIDNPPLIESRGSARKASANKTSEGRRSLPKKYSHSSVLRLEITTAMAGTSHEIDYDLPTGGP